MSELTYTDPKLVSDVKHTPRPMGGRTASGYGGKIPSSAMVRYGKGKIWHRVYVMQYGNAGTPYINHAGKQLIIDIDTAHRIMNEGK